MINKLLKYLFLVSFIIISLIVISCTPTTSKDYSKDIDSLNNSIKDLSTKLTTVEAQNKALQETLAKTQPSTYQLPSNISALPAKVDTLNSNLNQMQQSVNEIKTQVANIKQVDTSKLATQIANLSTQIQKTQSDVDVLRNFLNASEINASQYGITGGYVSFFDEYNGFLSSGFLQCGNNLQVAQSFTTTYKSTISKLALYLNGKGSPTDAIVSIRNTDSSGNPTGQDLVYKVIQSNNIIYSSGSPSWVIFDIPSLTLNQGIYCIILKCNGSAGNYIAAHYNSLSPNGKYLYGTTFTSTNGVNWTKSPTYDIGFRIVGNAS